MVTPEHHVALVDHLVEASEPVRRIWPVRTRMAVLVATWSAAGLLVAYAGARPDLAERLDDPTFVVGLATLMLATAFTAMMALRCAVPGRAPTRLEAWTALGVIAGAVMALWADSGSKPAADPAWHCSVRTMAIALLPWISLLVAIRRGAPVRLTSAALYAGTAAVLFATLVLRAACPAHGAAHWLAWHLAVVPLAALFASPLAARWLRGWRRGGPLAGTAP